MAATPEVDYFDQLVTQLQASLDRKGEVWIPCPNCGKDNNHFSFARDKGGLCFHCGYKTSLRALFESILGGQAVASVHHQSFVPVRKRRWWQAIGNEVALGFTQTPGLISAWQQYKPIPEEVIIAYRLGLGVFSSLWFRDDPGRQPDWIDPEGGPHWKCEHPRLIIPLYVAGEVVGFRCRSILCSCPRWLSPGGSRLVLFNGGRLGYEGPDSTLGDSNLGPPSTRILMIVENPIDALLIEHYWDHWAVATLGVSIWKNVWTDVLLGLDIQSIVAYDNDAPGNTTDPEVLRRWTETNPKVPPPENGKKLVRKLRLAGIRSHLYRWPDGLPRGTDVGDLFVDKKTRKTSATQRLAFWFIRNILGREPVTADFRGMHLKHAKLLLQDYSVAEICGCWEAIRDGLLGDFQNATYLTFMLTLEPPLVEQFREYIKTRPPVYLEAESAQWEERKSRTYAEISSGE